MMLEEEVEEIPEPKIKNRKELHQFLELIVNKIYELEKEYRRLEEELNMVKGQNKIQNSKLQAYKGDASFSKCGRRVHQ